MNLDDALALLVKLGGNPDRAVYLREPASEASIAAMQGHSQRDLGEVVPEEYVALLRITNGLQINGAYFKEAENLVAENLELRHPEIFVLGDDGGMSWQAFDRRDRRFHTINFGFPDEQVDSYDNFGALLLNVLKEQQAID